MDDSFEWGRIAAMAKAWRKALGILLLAIAPLTVAGCMELETVVRVNPDGSGTITERLVLSNQIFEMMTEMAPDGQPAEFYDEQELRKAAGDFGEGVIFISATVVEADFGKGYEAGYAFTDINKIRVSQTPGDKVPGGGADNRGFTSFTMRPGSPAELVIHWPVTENETGTAETTASTGETATAQTPEQQAMAMEIMKTAFQDMRVAIQVEVVGQIVDSNATHLDGSRVTLVDISFNELLNSDEAMNIMVSKGNQSLPDMKEIMTLIPGFKFEIEPEVNVWFE